MAFRTLSIRIPEEAHRELEKQAKEKQQKVSHVARELIANGLKGASQADNRLVIEYLEGFTSVLDKIHSEAARSRYYGEQMVSRAVDIQNLLVEGKVAKKGAKQQQMARFRADSMQEGRERRSNLAKAIESNEAAPKQRPRKAKEKKD